MMTKLYTLTIDIIQNETTFLNPNHNNCQLSAKAFSLKEIGLYIGNIEGWDITAKDIESFGLFTETENIDLTDKAIYRYPYLDLPRQKVDLLKDRFNMKVIRNPDKADYHVISNKTIKNLLSHTWSTHYTYTEIYKFLVNLKEQKLLSEDALIKAREILEILPKDARVSIERPYNYSDDNDVNNAKFQKTKGYISMQTGLLNDNRVEKGRDIIIDSQDKMKTFIDIHTSVIPKIFDTDVCNIIDADLAILDTNQLDDIIKMIHSTNREDRTLALEMLANCNVDKSFDVVSNIFYWEYDWIKDTNNWNTINVKSLRSRMKAFEGNSSNASIYSYNNYIKQLISCDKLTKFAVDYTRQKLYENVLGSLVGKKADVFSVSLESLGLKKDFMNNILNEVND